MVESLKMLIHVLPRRSPLYTFDTHFFGTLTSLDRSPFGRFLQDGSLTVDVRTPTPSIRGMVTRLSRRVFDVLISVFNVNKISKK